MPTEPNTPATSTPVGTLVTVVKEGDSLFGHVFKVVEEGYDWLKVEIETLATDAKDETEKVWKFFSKKTVVAAPTESHALATTPTTAQVAASVAATGAVPSPAPASS